MADGDAASSCAATWRTAAEALTRVADFGDIDRGTALGARP
jgi:hypothetical protein